MQNQEMQSAINYAQANSGPAARAKWNAVPKTDDTPTVEEFLDFMVNTLKNLGY